MVKREIDVTQTVTVELDESRFTPEFMEEFRRYFYEFDTIDEHFDHLAQLAARGVIETPCFIEGYGKSENMGIVVRVD
jgi:hypothetical protein